MNKYPGIDYKFTPESYWADTEVLQALLRNVKGAERRKMITAYYEAGNFQELEESFSKVTLSDEERFRLASIHPMFMGGEYLPDYGRDETEIARIELKSVTADVISIRARLEDDTIHYSVVDEYEGKFTLETESGFEPFSLAELVRFIDGTNLDEGWGGGLALTFNNANAESQDRGELLDFTNVSSDIYTEVEQHYDQVFAEWANAEVEEEEEVFK
ncbi:hypothetical protein OAF00_01710 [bacterium]|nr:hypothetical protein [bacterium]